jgi:dethiobiotin synthetase
MDGGMRHRGLFVTGTDTEVGKTVVTASMAAALRRSGVHARALKPVATGVEEGPGEDARLLGHAAGHPPLCGVALPAPLSPHRAALLADTALSVDSLARWVGEHEGVRTLVEGAGGWEVPLSWTARMSDLATALRWPVVLVVRDRLGALNHALLTADAIARRGLLLALVAVGEVVEGEAVPSNEEDLRTLLRPIPVARMPRLARLTRPSLALAGASLLQYV